MYAHLRALAHKPAPFSRYTTDLLWTQPHLAQQMLAFHLNQETDLASRRLARIEQVVRYLDKAYTLAGKKLCDLGCGPGLYTHRLAQLGAEVTGIDFSSVALAHAKVEAKKAGLSIHYISADYLQDTLPTGFDLITLIYHDFATLSPMQRATLLKRIRGMLNPGGELLLELPAEALFTTKVEALQVEENMMGGFWSASPYVGMLRQHLYTDLNISLDHYWIVEQSGRSWEVLNWMQYYTPEQIQYELTKAGFTPGHIMGGLCGEPWSEQGDALVITAS
ncbi:class I SAM-dependent methyltransferase [Magnetococcus sp. PR-3]|uniref:class I SAM-dependent methyltransferase n=1 Tax=Magnetococcus sp. PR-3 TaxID=3120355 RepID=UPI002FCE5E6F